MKRVYLDHAATTPILPQARAAMAAEMERWANPSSPHAEGRAARARLEQARGIIAATLGWRHDIILTSGASEAIEIAARRAIPAGRMFGATEHDIVPHAMGKEASVVPVDANGLIDLAVLGISLSGGPALVAIQHVNNESGVIQPAADIAGRIARAGSLWLADCAQSAGKIDLPDADFIAVSAHKIGGPPGVGALLVRDLATLRPSGGQEKGYRRGTQDLPSAAAFAAALAEGTFRSAMPRLAELRRRLDDGVDAIGGTIVAANAPRIATIGTVALPGLSSASLLTQLDLAGISVSVGSACSSGSMKPSRILASMGVAKEVAESAIRVSFGPATSEAEIDALIAALAVIAERKRAA